MKQQDIYIIDKDWFEDTANKNPIFVLDHNLEKIYPRFYSANYDLKILSTKPATEQEKAFPGYNDYRERYGHTDISIINRAVSQSTAKNIFLNGFNQEQFEYIAPLIENTAEILYLFKCPKISNLSHLTTFKKLRCVHIYWNNSLEKLWDTQNNSNLKVLSFLYVTKLKHIEKLVDSCIEYINFDSSDNFGKKKELSIDKSVFERMVTLKRLFI